MAESEGLGLINFETGDTSQCDLIETGTDNTFAASTASALHGSYGGELTFGGTINNNYYDLNDFGDQSIIYVRKYFYISSLAASAACWCQMLRIAQDDTTVAYIRVSSTTGGTCTIDRLYYYNGSLPYLSVSVSVSKETLHYVELGWDYNSGSSNYYYYFDGTLVGSTTGIAQTDYQYINEAYGGLHAIGGGYITGTIYEDDFKIDSSYIGAYSESGTSIDVSDDFSMSETVSIVVTIDVSDSFSCDETVGILNELSIEDSFSLNDAMGLTAVISVSDSLALNERINNSGNVKMQKFADYYKRMGIQK